MQHAKNSAHTSSKQSFSIEIEEESMPKQGQTDCYISRKKIMQFGNLLSLVINTLNIKDTFFDSNFIAANKNEALGLLVNNKHKSTLAHIEDDKKPSLVFDLERDTEQKSMHIVIPPYRMAAHLMDIVGTRIEDKIKKAVEAFHTGLKYQMDHAFAYNIQMCHGQSFCKKKDASCNTHFQINSTAVGHYKDNLGHVHSMITIKCNFIVHAYYNYNPPTLETDGLFLLNKEKKIHQKKLKDAINHCFTDHSFSMDKDMLWQTPEFDPNKITSDGNEINMDFMYAFADNNATRLDFISPESGVTTILPCRSYTTLIDENKSYVCLSTNKPTKPPKKQNKKKQDPVIPMVLAIELPFTHLMELQIETCTTYINHTTQDNEYLTKESLSLMQR